MKARLIAAITIAVLLCTAPPLARAAAQEEAANQDYVEGMYLYQQGKYGPAEAKFMSALRKYPKHLSSLFMMGETLSRDVRRLREAEGWYRKVLRDGEGNPHYENRTLFSLGTLYMEMGYNDRAVEEYKRLISISPDFHEMPRVYNQMGVAEYRLDRYDEALADFKLALRKDPTLLEAAFNMKTLQGQLSLINTARYYERMGDYKAATEQYDKAREAYPDYVAAWYHEGVLSMKQGDYQAAVRYLTRARILNPAYLGQDEIPYQLALAYAGRGAPGDADEALRLLSRSPSYKDSSLKAGVLLIEKGDMAGAEDRLTKASDATEDKKAKAEAYFQLGRISLGKGDRERADEYFGQARELSPDEPRYNSPTPARAKQ